MPKRDEKLTKIEILSKESKFYFSNEMNDLFNDSINRMGFEKIQGELKKSS